MKQNTKQQEVKAEFIEGTERVHVQTECLGDSERKKESLVLVRDLGIFNEGHGMVYMSFQATRNQ